jgi:hypothetical protein
MSVFPPAQTWPPEHPPRTSILAVTSLVLSLACCIPGLGALGMVVGAAALFAIAGAHGTLRGKSPAIAAIVIGLVTSLFWVVLIFGAALTVRSTAQAYVPVLAAVQARDALAVRASLTARADAALTDERLAEFAAEVEADWGAFRDAPDTIAGVVSGSIEVGPAWGTMDAAKLDYRDVIPWPARFDRGRALVFFAIDPRAPGPVGAAKVVNVGVSTPGADVRWLLPPGAP